jgi:hypothetical protein
MNELTILKDVVSQMKQLDGKTVKFYYGTELDINGYLSQSDGNKYPLIYLITPYTLTDGFINDGDLTFVIAIRNMEVSMPNTKRAELTFPILYELYKDFKKKLNFNSFVTIEDDKIRRTTYFGYKINKNEKNETIDIWDALSVRVENIKFKLNSNC